METMFRRQKRFDNWLDRETKDARIEDRLMLDNDNVRIVRPARRYGRHQRQRVFGYIAQREPAGLPPGKRVEQRGDEARKKTPGQRRISLERSGPSACFVCCH